MQEPQRHKLNPILVFKKYAAILVIFIGVLIWTTPARDIALKFLADMFVDSGVSTVVTLRLSELEKLPENSSHLDIGKEFINSGSELIKKSASIVIFFLTVIVSALAAYIYSHIEKEKHIHRSLKVKLEKADADSKSYLEKISELKDHLTKPNQRLEKIKIAMFGKLLVYAPLYIADEFGYFEDEGLDVEFIVSGGDEEVAQALNHTEYPFGVADPFSVMTSHSSISEEDPQKLKILLPLLKKLDLTVFAKKDILDADRELIISCYKSPSTTYAAALHLREQLKDLGKVVEIEEKEPTESYFLNRNELPKLLQESDIVLLWNPVSSWMLSDIKLPNSDQYGLLVVNYGNPFTSNREHWDIIALDEAVPTDWEKWHPLNGRSEGYQVLASAIITSEYILKHRPELCRRFSRAICRALVRLEGADWNGVELNQNNNRGLIWKAVANKIADDYLEPDVIKNLVNNDRVGLQGRSIFPFIESISNYSESSTSSKYCNHLRNLEKLWEKDSTQHKKLPRNHLDAGNMAPSDYSKYFTDFKLLK